MAFRPAGISANIARFNSAVSADFLENYETFIDTQIQESNAQVPHQTFAPSSFRCERRQWFRLRGTEPDTFSKSDRTLRFVADIGTACHSIIQHDLQKMLGDGWVSVENYFKENPIPYEYSLEITPDSLETRVSIPALKVRFACDGILKIDGKYYLLEIKTTEYSSFESLSDPKEEHIDQVKSYASLLHIQDVLFLYVERTHGEMKCFLYKVSEAERDKVLAKMQSVLQAVETNIAPPRLPTGDKWCGSNYCPYYKKCKEWG